MFSSLAVLLAAFWSCMWLSDITGLTTSTGVSRWFFTRRKGDASLQLGCVPCPLLSRPSQ